MQVGVYLMALRAIIWGCLHSSHTDDTSCSDISKDTVVLGEKLRLLDAEIRVPVSSWSKMVTDET